MAYSNVTPPPLPEYDSETYGYYILVFSYEIGAEDWYSVQLRYAPWRFSYDEALGITNGGNNFLQVYGDGTWGDWGQNQETLAIKPGQVGKTYQRIYTNHNIFDANDEIYMAADTILPPDENRFPIHDFLNGLVMALCGRPIRWPSREPVAYLYNGVRLPGINSVYTPELQKTHPYAEIHYTIPDHDYFGIGYYMVSFYTALPYVNAEDGKIYFRAECDCIYHSAWNTDGSVRNGFENPGYENNWPTHLSWGIFSENWIWTNFDVCDSTGKVLLAGSEPVPVYE